MTWNPFARRVRNNKKTPLARRKLWDSIRPVVEGLEDRVVPSTVTNTLDSGPGSLRAAILNATPGEMINFSVVGTIVLTSGQLTINQNLTIAGPGAGSLIVSG